MTYGAALDDCVDVGNYADHLEKFEWRKDIGVAEVMGAQTQRYLLREPGA